MKVFPGNPVEYRELMNMINENGNRENFVEFERIWLNLRIWLWKKGKKNHQPNKKKEMSMEYLSKTKKHIIIILEEARNNKA